MSKRPEAIAPPELFYDDREAKKYARSTRMIEIQSQMSRRALELLALPPGQPRYLLDIGCGSGLSGEVLSEEGHEWVGVDISPSMLGVALEREVEGDLALADMGQGLFFRPGSFDGAISVSALQWLCNADKKSHVPKKRLEALFESLYQCLRPGARAVFQLYPESPQAMQLITECAMRCGFSGGLVVDFPNSAKAKKLFLCLFAGASVAYTLPQGLSDDMAMIDEGDESKSAAAGGVSYSRPTRETQRANQQRRRRNASKKVRKKSKAWINEKKEKMRMQGRSTAKDSKYTARKRRPKF